MHNQSLSKVKGYFTGFVALTIWSMLVWQYLHDGVPSHHLLHRADLPAISNWWGAVLLPALTWFLISATEKRIEKEPENNATRRAVLGFIISALYGTALSLAFSFDYPEISSVMFPGILLFAALYRVYRAEFILGFILSMSITFGAVLPTIFGTLIGLLSLIVYNIVQFMWKHIVKILTMNQTRES